MNQWKKIRLGDYCDIGRGSSPRPIIDQAYFENGTIPWIKIADATASFKYIYETKQYVNEFGASFSRKLPPGSLIVAASGTLGFAIFLGIEGCVHDGWLYFKKIDSSKIDKQYLYYLLNTFTKSFNSVSYGAAIQNINTDILRNISINLPPLSYQQKVASILSAYDDLIENNNKRIALLEKAAEEIYREWFVRMRFPDWEQVKFEKGVPEGWEIGSFTDYIDVMSGGTPKTDVPQYWGDDIPWFTPRDLHDSFFVFDTERRITEDGLRHCASKLYPPNTIFITARGTVGNCVMNVVPMAMSQTSYALLGKNNLPQYYVFYLTLSMVTSLKQQATGAVFDTIVVDTFRKQKVMLPSKPIIEKFMGVVAPMLEQLKALQQKNEKLKQSRDLLLARLISGKLPVEGLDIRFPPSMVEDSAGRVERG